MGLVFSNNSSTILAVAIADGVATSMTVQTGGAANFATLAAGDFERVTITDGTNFEVVEITSWAADVATITRGVEGTAQAWLAGTPVEARLTAGILSLLQSGAAPVVKGGVVQAAATSTHWRITVGEPVQSQINNYFWSLVFCSDADAQTPISNTGATATTTAAVISGVVANILDGLFANYVAVTYASGMAFEVVFPSAVTVGSLQLGARANAAQDYTMDITLEYSADAGVTWTPVGTANGVVATQATQSNLKLVTGLTGGYPVSPVLGQTFYNTTTATLMVWNGSAWV